MAFEVFGTEVVLLGDGLILLLEISGCASIKESPQFFHLWNPLLDRNRAAVWSLRLNDSSELVTDV